MYNYKKFSNAPHIVRVLCQNHSAFIIGGGAKYLMDYSDSCKDWDIVVPLSQWGLAQRLIPKEAIHNTFGGSKIIDESYVVDIWGMDLSQVIISSPEENFYLVHPQSLFSGILSYGFFKNG